MEHQDFAELMKDVGAGEGEEIERSPRAGDEKSAGEDTGESEKAATTQKPSKTKGGLTTSEERESGEVSWDVYRGYLRLAKATKFFIGVLILCWAAQLTSVFNDWWLTWWTQQKFDLPEPVWNLIYLFGAMVFSAFTFVNGIFWANVGMLTAKNIHMALLKSVLAGRMSFFDVKWRYFLDLPRCPSR